MGLLVDGVWMGGGWKAPKASDGRVRRPASAFRSRLGTTKFPAVAGRYHLYVSLACPWAHRTLVVRKLKGLEKVIDVSVVNPLMLENGWELNTDFEGATGDLLYHKKYMWEIYAMADPTYTGRVTVPVLWDTVEKTIVNNESSEIIEMFNSVFDHLDESYGVKPGNYYPEEVIDKMKELDSWVYSTVNDGVYKSGFATTQEAYNENVNPLFESLDRLEGILSKSRYLTGPKLTMSDIRLWTTLVRFDHVYVTHFKCDKKRIASDYPNLLGFLRDIYQIPGVAETVSLPHIRNHYYRSHGNVNLYGVVPIGPEVDWTVPAHRENI